MDARHARTHHLHWFLDFEANRPSYAPLLHFVEGAKLRPGTQALEVGCAAGTFLRHLKQSSIEIEKIIGLDPDMEALSHARTELVVRGSALELPFRDASFDLVFIVNVLHHLVGGTLSECRCNWAGALQEAERVCRPGGYVMVRDQLAVRTKLLQRLIFLITSLLASREISVPCLHIASGEVLAFLTPGDMLRLCTATPGRRSSIIQFSKESRPDSEFSGIVRALWKSQTCSLTAILQRA